MTGFSEDLEQLLEAERDIDAPLPAQREHLLGRLQPLLVVPAALAVGASTATTTATATQATGGLLKAKLGAVALSAALLGGAVGATGHAYFAAPAPQPAAPQVAPVLPQAATSQAQPEPTPDVVPPLVASPEANAPEPSAARAPRPAPVGSLRAERLLLEAASAALMRGDAESALVALRQHAQRFPKGALAEEREALLARARAASGKSP
jgi:TolA-binding protein